MRLQGLFEDKKSAEERVFETVTREAPERTADPDRAHQQRGGASSVENWLRIGIENKEASNIDGGYSLGKREVVSSILTGSTRNS
jgi:hypothetical protein